MNRIAVLLETPVAALVEFDHPPDETHRDPGDELAGEDSINFVEDGSFEVGMGGASWQLGPGSLFVTERGMSFSCRHDCDAPTDRCLSIRYSAEAVEELRRADVPRLIPPVGVVNTRERYLRYRLRSAGAGQEIRFELLAGALYQSVARHDRSRPPAGRSAEMIRSIQRAADLIDAEFSRALTLSDLAEAAGLSRFHFARAFRDVTGLPPHRYLAAVRLRHAAMLLAGGATVTATCYQVGFGSLSHFITAFRRRYGVRPSDSRTGIGAKTLRSAFAAPLWGERRRA